jgi:Cu/Ag efflux protein CusF
MRSRVVLGVAVLLALGVAATAFCAESGAAPEQTKTGVVRKVDAEAKKIVVMVTRELTFTITEATRIVQGDATNTLAGIKVGDTVTVVYERKGPDSRVASKVTIAAPTPVAAPEPAK